MEASVTGVANHRLRIAYHRLEISAILFLFTYQVHVFVELGRVVGLGK